MIVNQKQRWQSWTWTAGVAHKELSRNSIGTRFFRPVNLRTSRDGSLRDWVFYGMSRNGSCGITQTCIFFSFLILPKKNEREERIQIGAQDLKVLTYVPPKFLESNFLKSLPDQSINQPIDSSEKKMSDLPPEKTNMELSSSSSMPGPSSSLHHSYSRKQKSLGLLCTKSVPFIITFLYSFGFFDY